MNTNIVQVTGKNWHEFRQFLLHAMSTEFPKDEQLEEDGIAARVHNHVEYDGRAKHFVDVVIAQGEPVGFTIYHLFSTDTQPTSLMEYGTIVGDNKSQGYGGMLAEHIIEVLGKEGALDTVIETEPVPRVVRCEVHSDVEGCYVREGDSLIFVRGDLSKQLEGIVKRNRFHERNGFAIVPDYAYCQPNLDPQLQESYVGQYRVPLDLQVRMVDGQPLSEISAERLIQISSSLARFNYHLGEDTDAFVALQAANSHLGKMPSTFGVMPYSELAISPEVRDAYRLLGVE